MNAVIILGAIAGLGAVLAFSSDGIQSEAGQAVDFLNDTIAPLTSDWNRFDSLFQNYGAKYGVDWKWLKAFCLNESDLGRVSSVARGLSSPADIEGSKSSDGKSWGIMQVTLTTAKGLDPQASEEKLNSPEYSIDLGAKYISQLMRMFPKSDPDYVMWVVKSYNQGPGNTKKEAAGVGGGFADVYWDRWERNLNRVEENA